MWASSKPLVLASILIVGCSGPAVTPGLTDGAAPNEANVIIVNTDLDFDALYRKAGQILVDGGFTIDHSDKDLGVIKTSKRDYSGKFMVEAPVKNMVVTISIRDGSRVLLRGTFEDDWQIEKTGQAGSPYRMAWTQLHRIAEEFGAEISYKQ